MFMSSHDELAKEHMSAVSGLVVPGSQSAGDVAGVIGADVLRVDIKMAKSSQYSKYVNNMMKVGRPRKETENGNSVSRTNARVPS